MKTKILKGKGILAYLVLTSIISLIVCNEAKSEEKLQLKIFSGPSRHSNYALAFGWSEILRKHHPYIGMTNIETKGSAEVIQHARNSQNKKNSLFFMEYGSGFIAIHSTGPFKGKEPLSDLKSVITICPSTTHLVVSLDIKKPQDLDGKIIGRPITSISLTEATNAMIKAWNLPGRVRVVDGDLKSLLDALNDGKINAVLVPSSIPIGDRLVWNPLMTEALATRKSKVYPFTKEDIAGIIREGGLGWIPYQWKTPGFVEPQWTISGDLAWVASTEMDEKIIYEIVKTAAEHVKEFGEYHATGKGITKERLAFSFFLTENGFHPGAVKAYKELGIHIGKK